MSKYVDLSFAWAGADDAAACVQGLCSLVERCLNKDADSRPAASELLKDPIFK
jgi:hypothetical protein